MIEKIKLGIVCPMANEKETVRSFIPDVLKHCKGFNKLIFYAILDNASTDGTIDIVKEIELQTAELRLVWAPENQCVVDAYIRGYREALISDCDWILEIDAGYSHQPSEIPLFFETMQQGFDCVFGSRFCRGGKFAGHNFQRYLISRGGTFLANMIIGTKLRDMTSGFELFSKSALKLVLAKGIRSRGHFFQTEIKTFCRKLKITEVPITYSNPSVSINSIILFDSLSNLGRLFLMRLRGQL